MRKEPHPKNDRTGWHWLNPDMGWSAVLFVGPLLVAVIMSLIVAILKWLG